MQFIVALKRGGELYFEVSCFLFEPNFGVSKLWHEGKGFLYIRLCLSSTV